MLTALEQRALEAARSVACASGLELDDPVVIHAASNVLVHLRPAPIVARVMSGTVALHTDPQNWLEREIALLEFLAPSRLAVLPSRLIGPGPCCHGDLWMTFTEWVPDAEPASEWQGSPDLMNPRELGRALKDLHEALRAFDGELGGMSELLARISRLLRQLRPSTTQESDAVASLRERLDTLRTVAFESRLPTQAPHGDVSLRNLLRTPRGLVWNDFEDTFRGPVHWDLASYLGSFRKHGASDGSVQEMLDAYGWDDESELTPFLAAQDVYDQIWRMYDQQRRR